MTWSVAVVGVLQGFGGLLAWRLLRWGVVRASAHLRSLIEAA